MTIPSNHSVRSLRQPERAASRETSNNTARFWDRIARRYAAKPVQNQEAYAHKLTITRKFLDPRSELLEIGCGTGSTALAHAPHVRHVRAIDISHKMIEIARSKARETGIENVEFSRSTASEALCRNPEYDAILALNLLHLLSDWQRTIELVHQQLKPGGVFVTSTPCLQDEHAWLGWIAPLGARVGLLPNLSFFTQEQLKSEMCGAGFRIEYAWQANSRNGLFLVARKTQ